MPKLGSYEVRSQNAVDHLTSVKIKVDVLTSKKGLFYLYFDAHHLTFFSEHGVNAQEYCRARTGEFNKLESTTLGNLLGQVEKLLDDITSGQVIEDKLVIIYKLGTECTYYMSDSGPVPNATLDPDKENSPYDPSHWVDCMPPFSERSFKFGCAARIMRKKVYRFLNNVEKTFFYADLGELKNSLGEFGTKLNGFRLRFENISDAYRAQVDLMHGRIEMNYTEENAKFFVDVLLGICLLNEKIRQFLGSAQDLERLIQLNQKLLL